ncbi:PcfJ domain-containing protein [Orbus sturtevantii]|uniref:PcfJ domain-containing protein n=1 Tax=Orbus sturtevantii TaxID=3074109 RepID=UPI00370D256C
MKNINQRYITYDKPVVREKYRFGSKRVENFYDDCMKVINEIDVGYFYRVTVKRHVTEIIICNMFKLKVSGSELSYYKYRIHAKRWQNLKNSKGRNNDFVIKHLSLIEATSTLYKRFLTDAILEIMYHKKNEFIFENEDTQLGFEAIKRIILAKLLKKAAKHNAPLLGRSFMRMLWDSIINKEVYSYSVRIYLKPPTLAQYFNIAKMDIDSLRRIGKENPNLFPVLASLKPDDIKQVDLFSKKRWVASSSAHDDSICLPLYFSCKSTWNFFKQMKSRFIKDYLHNVRQANDAEYSLCVIESLMVIPHIKRQRVYIINFLQSFLFRYETNGYEPMRGRGHTNKFFQITANQRTVLVNLLMEQLLLIRSQLSLPIFKKDFIKFNGRDVVLFIDKFKDILDFLIHNPDVYLRKNKTFNSLLADTRQWEQVVAMNKSKKLAKITWHKSIPDTIIEGLHVKELNTGQDVYIEGIQMHHCIQTYIKHAKHNTYKIFSISSVDASESKGERATLGAAFNRRDKRWKLEQVRGVCNEEVSEQILHVSNEIVSMLNKTAQKALNGAKQG